VHVHEAAEIERQQAEEALRISQEKFSKALGSSPSAVTISTLKEGRYVEVNESCLQMLGYSHTEMLESRAIEFVHQDTRLELESAGHRSGTKMKLKNAINALSD
jgi:PAS domain S-box-containing protein